MEGTVKRALEPHFQVQNGHFKDRKEKGLLTHKQCAHIMCLGSGGDHMANITISIDEALLKAGRKYAEKHQTSINGLIRKLLEETVESQSKDWLQECFDLMDRAKGNSRGKRWKREELYDV